LTTKSPSSLSGKKTTPETWLRFASHGLALALVALAVWLAHQDFLRQAEGFNVATNLGWTATPSAVPPTPQATVTEIPIALPVPTFAPPTEDGNISRGADPYTHIPDRPRYEIIKYIVQDKDTLFGIAEKFNLKPETVLWGNAALADNPNLLSKGQELNILPVDGALRVVIAGDTLEKIAKAFHGNADEIVAFPGNNLDPDHPQLQVGQNIIIPGGWRDSVVWQLPAPPSRSTSGKSWSGGEPGACAGPFSGPVGSGAFVWPANNHYLSGTDYLPQGHPGIDIAAGFGAPIYASDTGVIVFAGWSTRGYGNLVIVDHGNGWQTAYAHLSQINVSCGGTIYQGQLLGLSGSTGNSTGPHLHFEMRSSEWGRVNPWLYLP
jgi:murein DD-endopeptidase MepM/ murein hydrolase activator NlpD